LRLLYQRSNQGFTAAAFRTACDGRAPTSVLMKDTDANIVDGFTALTWESSQIPKPKGGLDDLS
jgi:hypothetical protein